MEVNREENSQELADSDGSQWIMNFEKELSDWINIYVKLNNMASDELMEYYDNVLRKPMAFPIDIRGMVEQHNIHIYETNLNADIGFCVEKINGYYKEWKYRGREINLENRNPESTKRYILAHEFSHFLIGQRRGSGEVRKGLHCIDPLFPKNWEEIAADILACFLLFPPDLVLKSLERYAGLMEEQNEYPIDAFEWLKKLGQWAQVSTYFTISSYQHLKFYMYKICIDSAEDSRLYKKYGRFFKRFWK